MPLTFEPLVLKVGKHDLVDVLKGESEFSSDWEDSKDFCGVANRIIKGQSESKIERLRDIAKRNINYLEQNKESAPCVVLLPEKESGEDYSALYTDLKQYFGPLQSSAPKLIYPFGRASFLMSFKKLSRLLDEHESGVWVLGIDTDAAFLKKEQEEEPKEVACNDSFFLVKVKKSKNGLNYGWGLIDVSTLDKQVGESTRFIFRASTKRAKQRYSHLSLPFAVPKDAVSDWNSEIHHLHKYLNENTEFKFLETTFGDLGANSGLWKVIHTSNVQEKDPVDGFCHFQMDVSDNNFRAAASFTWQL
ncbi:hypothetical protein [Vibrio nigripulchritudo]|uniref:hypothetical protein n=1 Tax=Vibrio nigripulchritudo TaxID=28173 RepID=UPI00249138F2|nr:hypothetical protein [Vibrio nigripulchritudo]BDU37426.1 hypothetical protein TUMSATVNIG2_18950 [Vibrio nigripulchritudo]BDU43147.1 hypothetical protein TUMSATVNIG3_19450 [Vibrio nigripulchritudo]